MDRNNKANHTPQSVILTNLLMLCTTVFTANAQAAMELYFIHNGHLGTPQAVTDQNQNIVWRKHQKPFGETTEETGTLDPHLRFPGQYFDEETGYHYNYFRDYDPGIGRYIQSDPIGLDGGINTYGYVQGNPIRYTDPKGLVIQACAANPAACAAAVREAARRGAQALANLAGAAATSQSEDDSNVVPFPGASADGEDAKELPDLRPMCQLVDAEVENIANECPADNVTELDKKVTCFYRCPGIAFLISQQHIVPNALASVVSTKIQALAWCPATL